MEAFFPKSVGERSIAELPRFLDELKSSLPQAGSSATSVADLDIP
jgi:hypothetical protein